MPEELIERARVLDNFYIPTRYPNSHPEGAPFEHFGPCRVNPLSTMPVRSLNSRVLHWPDAHVVTAAVRAWALDLLEREPDVRRVGIFGSYAREDAGMGSDLDIVIVLDHTDLSMFERGLRFDATRLPVPADVLVYMEEEWGTMDSPFAKRLRRETVWMSEPTTHRAPAVLENSRGINIQWEPP